MTNYERDRLYGKFGPPMAVWNATTATFSTTGYTQFPVRAVPLDETRRCSYCNSLFETRALKANCENCGAPL